MYCSKCGFEMKDGALFCEKCGTKIENSQSSSKNKGVFDSSMNLSVNEKQEVIGKLQNLIQPLNRYLKLCKEKEATDQKLEWHNRREIKKDWVAIILPIIFGPLLLTVINWYIADMILTLIFKAKGYSAPFADAVGGLGKLLQYMFIILLIFWIIEGIIIAPISKKLADKRLSSTIQKNTEMIGKYESRIENINKLTEETVIEINRYVDVVPPDYRYPMAVEYLYKSFLNGRANSIPESVNLFEEQVHRWKVENYQVQMLDMQQQQQKTMSGIRTATTINAAASVAQFLLK
ncbi:MAG: zinc ribbon domain-containing protein [Lachnospiraceae bacterium]|nr:zinc ribbon domain-containing protein [Lachnospiraceae bacterium]